MQTLNQTQFAKLIGVDKSYVTQLKQAGRLVFAENGKVDVEASKLLIEETADPNRDDVKKRHATERGTDTQADEIGKEKPKKADKPAKVIDPNAASFSAGRAKEQHFKALQAELEYQKHIGELVSKADMQAAVADVVTTFRQKLENMPHRLSSELIGQDLQFVRARLKQECHDILGDLSREFSEKLAQKQGDAA